MTSQDHVEGGLAEPTELEPEQGTLALALPGAAARGPTGRRRRPACCARPAGSARTTPTTPSGPSSPARPSTGSGSARSARRTSPAERRRHTPAPPRRAGATSAWSCAATTERLNAEALADLAGGATSLWLHAGPDTDLAVVLDGVLLDLAPVVLDATAEPVALAERFLAHLGDTTPAAGTNLGCAADASDDDLVAVARLALDAGVLGVVVDASGVHDRGASDAQELGWSIVAAARVLRVLERAGIPVDAGSRPGRVPLRRDRRAVPDHRQAAGGPAALGAAAGDLRGAPRRASGSTPSPAGR